MPSGTATKRARPRSPAKAPRRPAEPREPVSEAPEAESAPEAPEAPQAPWLDAEDLGGEQDWEDLTLPFMGKRVRVRFLDTPEVAVLQFMPDLGGYQELLAKLRDGKAKDVDPAEFSASNFRYLAKVAHIAITARGKEMAAPRVCHECTAKPERPVSHRPSLLTFRQTNRMQPADLDAISAVAFRAQAVMELRPFSMGEMPPDTPMPAESSASTPEPSSSE